MYKGTSASAGIGIGKAVIVEEAELVITRQAVSDGEAEIQRFKGALEQTIKDTERLAEDLAVRVGEKEAEIMQGHMMLLSDPMLTGEIENSIKNDGVNSEFAIENVCNMYADMFASMGDELMQQRATDMRDIKTRMQRVLMGIQSVDISSLPAGSILVAKDLTPSMTAGINPANVTGIVTELGGRTSHSAILARALEIPAVVAVNSFIEGVKDGDDVVLDGSTGEVYVNPEADVKAGYEAKKVRFQEEKKELEQFIGKASVTKDGVRVEIVANIGKPEDVDKVLEYDGEGIGLFRTEFLFMDRTAMPTEDEQFEAYKKVAAAMNGKAAIRKSHTWGWRRTRTHSWATAQSVSALTAKRMSISRSCAPCCAPALLATSASWSPLLHVLRNTVRQRHWWRNLRRNWTAMELHITRTSRWVSWWRLPRHP